MEVRVEGGRIVLAPIPGNKGGWRRWEGLLAYGADDHRRRVGGPAVGQLGELLGHASGVVPGQALSDRRGHAELREPVRQGGRVGRGLRPARFRSSHVGRYSPKVCRVGSTCAARWASASMRRPASHTAASVSAVAQR